MTALLDIATYVPGPSVPISYLADAGLLDDPGPYERYYGFARVHRDPDEPLTAQLAAAVAGLRAPPAAARYVVWAPTIQPAAPYPDSVPGALCRALGLTGAVAFSLSQHACASALLAVDLCGRLLAGDPGGTALVLAGEQTFTPVAQVIPHSAVMGEAAAAVVVGADGPRDRVLSYVAHTQGEFHRTPFADSEVEARFQQGYTASLTAVIRAAVHRAGLAPGDLRLILPHNVNRMSWLRIRKDLGLPRDGVVLDNQAELGHCFGADPFVNYRTALAQDRLRPGEYYVMTAAGLGATLAAMVLRH